MTGQQIACPHCRNLLVYDSGRAGQLASCPYCRGQFLMPASLPSATEQPSAGQAWSAHPSAAQAGTYQPAAQPGSPPSAAERPAPGPASEYALSRRRRSSRAMLIGLVVGVLVVGVAATLVVVLHTASPSRRILGTWKREQIEGGIRYLGSKELELTFRSDGTGIAVGSFGRDAFRYRVDSSSDPPTLRIWETFLSRGEQGDVFQLHFPDNDAMRLKRKVTVPVLTGGSGSETRSVTEIFQRVD